MKTLGCMLELLVAIAMVAMWAWAESGGAL